MFSKILIANRGEIAVRVIKTCRRMGIATVVVYSDADADSLAVEMADETVHIGPSPANQSYLVADKIIAACRQTGAQAVHPGFGFLSENAGFAQRCADEGIVFIGPNPGAISAMGDKIESKKFAQAAGVSCVPGHIGEIDDTAHAIRISEEIGYPVMIKASAGGGGKGMRVVWEESEIEKAFNNAKAEALASFKNDGVYMEKFVEEPRHIEIQVAGDRYGTVCHMSERDCSIQRRHQKLVEESPSPFMTDELRERMGAAAVKAAQSLNSGVDIQVEVENLAELKEALDAGATSILIDNFTTEQMKEAVAFTNGRALLEASGGINLDQMRAIAATGVDRISLGKLTKDIKAVDFSMRISP